MATVRNLIERALRRIRELPAGETAAAEDADLALDILNGMLHRWKGQNVDTLWSDGALGDTFTIFVPPVDATAEVIAALDYQGTWDASANSPALATGTGTKGYFYKVATAGSTTLDDVTSWAVNDYAVFDGGVWLKSIDPLRFHNAIIDLLALEICPDFGKEPSQVLARSAQMGWSQILAAYIKPQAAGWDASLTHTYARPWTAGTSYTGS